MSDHISDSPAYKTCKNGPQCLHPNGPALPISEFYTRAASKDGHYSFCKACWKAITRPGKPKNVASEPGEMNVIEKLRSLGIYAAPGKSSEWNYIDVVAWGCVRIEVKTSNYINGHFRFTLGGTGVSQRRSWNLTDLVMLVCQWQIEKTYHLFPADHPQFYKNGRLLTGAIYFPRSHRTFRNSRTLNHDLMVAHLNNWSLIEECRERISEYFTAHPAYSADNKIPRPPTKMYRSPSDYCQLELLKD